MSILKDNVMTPVSSKVIVTLDDLEVSLDDFAYYKGLERYITPITFSVSFDRTDPPYQITLSRLYELFNGQCLPGSLKTKRLRKKRNKALINWFMRMGVQ